ncbi:MAG: hypothetical protein WC533_02750 [Candidatus Pacearchaeota archaeon]
MDYEQRIRAYRNDLDGELERLETVRRDSIRDGRKVDALYTSGTIRLVERIKASFDKLFSIDSSVSEAPARRENPNTHVRRENLPEYIPTISGWGIYPNRADGSVDTFLE